MTKNTILQQADRAFKLRQYEEAFSCYKEADNAGTTFTDDQLYRYSKLLTEQNEHSRALSLAEKISEISQEEDFDTVVLLYRLKEKIGATDDELIHLLEKIRKLSYDEELMLTLARLYAKSGSIKLSKRICKQIINFFHSGEWVEKARELLDAGGVLEESDPSEKSDQALSTEMQVKKTEKAKLHKNDTTLDMAEFMLEGDDLPDFLKEAFTSIVGMDSVKKEIKKFYDLVRLEKLRLEKLGVSANADRSYNFVLYGNPGTGKTMVARIIGKVLYILGIREKDVFVEVDHEKIVSEHIRETAKITKSTIDSARGGTLFIDEAYNLYKKDSKWDFGQEAIDTLLKDMEDNRSEYSVIMAGYRSQMNEMLNNSNPGFRSRFTFHIDIPDYSDDELIQIAHNFAHKHEYIIELAGNEAIRKRIARERIDETFGNARFIRELVNEAEMNMAARLAKMTEFCEEDLSVILAEDICPPDKNETNLSELIKQLNSLIGLSDVKKYINELMDKVLVQKEVERRGIPIDDAPSSMHMAFKGNAGTGKTTVARLIGQIFAELGMVKRGNVFVECTREDVVGQYQGHTAAKMKNVIRSAMGGVLFIDDAYSIVYSDGDNFGQEAIDTLLVAMENYRDSLIVVLAGYTTDIDKLIRTNQGLSSRVTHDLIFEDYSSEEMTEIFYMMSENSFYLARELYPKVKIMLEEKSQSSNFGNARGVRNVFEAVVRNQKSRIALKIKLGEELQDKDFFTILEEDFEAI